MPVKTKVINTDVLEESALAMAQATLQQAITNAGISRAEVARRIGSDPAWITHILAGDHNISIKTLAKALAACGYEMRINRVPIVQR